MLLLNNRRTHPNPSNKRLESGQKCILSVNRRRRRWSPIIIIKWWFIRTDAIDRHIKYLEIHYKLKFGSAQVAATTAAHNCLHKQDL